MAPNFLPSRGDGLDHVEQLIQQMLADDRHSFDAAAAALVGGASLEVVGPDLRATDHGVNEAEREVRRELVVHASVQGNDVDLPAVLIYMSIVKDIERIGDYAKNIYDLAEGGADLSGGEDVAAIIRHRDRVSSMITEVGQVFADRHTDRARSLIAEGDALLDEYDDLVSELVRSSAPSRHGVPRAMFYRHLKRIVAHLMNVLSAVVMPVDRLDYYDEDATSDRR